jgi:hypothetical protein
MKTTKKKHTTSTTAPATPATPDAFFAEEADITLEARKQALEVITRLLIWIAEADGMRVRGLRATIALHCVRPDLIGGITLEKIGDDAGISKQAAHKLAREFRLGMGLEP